MHLVHASSFPVYNARIRKSHQEHAAAALSPMVIAVFDFRCIPLHRLTIGGLTEWTDSVVPFRIFIMLLRGDLRWIC